jgi:hypothetical protein
MTITERRAESPHLNWQTTYHGESTIEVAWNPYTRRFEPIYPESEGYDEAHRIDGARPPAATRRSRTEPKETTLMKRREAIKFMVSIADEYDDGAEVSCTGLAEACADHFGCNHEGGPLDDETHEIWDWAVDAAEEYERLRDEAAEGGRQ